MCFQSYFMLSAHNKCDAYYQATLEKPKWDVCCLVSEEYTTVLDAIVENCFWVFILFFSKRYQEMLKKRSHSGELQI